MSGAPPGLNEVLQRTFSFPKRHFLSATDLNEVEVANLLDLADGFVSLNRQTSKKLDLLKGRTLMNLFFENSTRTQSSFELAGKRLGADVVNMSPRSSSISKGETLIDTAVTLNAMQPDLLVVRHGSSGAASLLSQKVGCSVVNAGDGQHEHPTQALLDALSMRRAFGHIAGLKVAICGDVMHSRVARSNIAMLQMLGAHVRLVGPPTLIPPDAPAWGVQVSYDIDALVPKLDVCYILRVQKERQRLEYFPSVREYARLFGLTNPRAASLPEHALIMHPGPMNRGVEIDSDVADLPESVIEEQVTNGIAIRMALLYLLLGGSGAQEAA